MLDVLLLVFFGVMAYRIAIAVRHERPIFLEFGQSRNLGHTAFLFHLGPVATLLLLGRSPLLAFLATIACYLPGLVLAHRVGAALQRAGTDRVNAAKSVATQAFGTALVGLIYAVGVFLYVVIIAVYVGVADA
jgi:hypothetical protein